MNIANTVVFLTLLTLTACRHVGLYKLMHGAYNFMWLKQIPKARQSEDCNIQFVCQCLMAFQWPKPVPSVWHDLLFPGQGDGFVFVPRPHLAFWLLSQCLNVHQVTLVDMHAENKEYVQTADKCDLFSKCDHLKRKKSTCWCTTFHFSAHLSCCCIQWA